MRILRSTFDLYCTSKDLGMASSWITDSLRALVADLDVINTTDVSLEAALVPRDVGHRVRFSLLKTVPSGSILDCDSRTLDDTELLCLATQGGHHQHLSVQELNSGFVAFSCFQRHICGVNDTSPSKNRLSNCQPFLDPQMYSTGQRSISIFSQVKVLLEMVIHFILKK